MGVFLQKSPAPCVLWTKLCHFHGPVIREGSRKYPWMMWEVKRPQPCFSNACQLFCGYSIRAHVFPEVEWLVENLSLFFFFSFESFTKSICDALICSVLIRSGQFFSLSSQVAFKGMNEREFWQKLLCFGSIHRSRAVFRFSLLELSRHS